MYILSLLLEKEGFYQMPKILIVEDDQTISKLIAASLSISGYESIPCFDGEEAIHTIKNDPHIDRCV